VNRLISFLLLPIILFISLGSGQKDAGNKSVVKDYDGNVYKTIKIGGQTWMAENLKVTHYRDGTPIPDIPDEDTWSKLTTGALCWMENDPPTYGDVYGALYNFHAVVDARNLCPAGWHVPTIEEWRTLENYLGGKEAAGGKMKDFASSLWKIKHLGASNESGFSAVPAGGRGQLGSPGDCGYYATWWSSTSHDADFAWHWGLHPSKSAIRSNPGHKASGFSVRCVKDRN